MESPALILFSNAEDPFSTAMTLTNPKRLETLIPTPALDLFSSSSFLYSSTSRLSQKRIRDPDFQPSRTSQNPSLC